MSDGIRERNESSSSHGARPGAGGAESNGAAASDEISVDVDTEWQTTVTRLLDAFQRITGSAPDDRQRSLLAEIGHAVVDHPDTDVQLSRRPRPSVVVMNGAVKTVLASEVISGTASDVERADAAVRIALD
ncbi:MAG: hypothetical protein AAGD33_04960 [Actinomycetota bacterium]